MFRHLLSAVFCTLLIISTALPALGQEQDHGVRLVAFGNEEMAFIRLPNGAFIWPQAEVLGGNRPRIILDFQGVNDWNEAYLPTGGGAIIRRIRTFLHADEKRLRVVLDLAGPPRRYAISLSYDTNPQGYEISVSTIPIHQ